MPYFEVFIPARGPVGGPEAFDVTLTVDAPNWLGALRTGLKTIGEGVDAIANVVCDIKEDDSIHVTDVATARVFRLRTVAAPEEPVGPHQTPLRFSVPLPTGVPKMETAEMVSPAKPAGPPITPLPPRASTEPAQPAVTVAPIVVAAPPPIATPVSTLKAEVAPPPVRIAGQFQTGPAPSTSARSAPVPDDAPIGRAGDEAPPKLRIDDVIGELFAASRALKDTRDLTVEQAANALLDLALQKIPAEAGSFYAADTSWHELRFVAVRGPATEQILKLERAVPVGQGIVGFCAQEGVCLLVSDMQNDPRRFAPIADAVGYRPRDTLCASVEKDGRLYGALQLLDSKTGGFDAAEMEVLRYIGLTAADVLERIVDR